MNGQESAAPMSLFMQKADVAVKQAPSSGRVGLVRLLVLLFTALQTCHVAYLRMKDTKTGDNQVGADFDAFRDSEEAWFQAVKTLQSVVETLASALHITAPDVFRDVAYYTHSEALEAFGDESLRYLLEINYYDPPSSTEFQSILDRLGQFIRSHFTMEEIFEASTSPSS